MFLSGSELHFFIKQRRAIHFAWLSGAGIYHGGLNFGAQHRYRIQFIILLYICIYCKKEWYVRMLLLGLWFCTFFLISLNLYWIINCGKKRLLMLRMVPNLSLIVHPMETKILWRTRLFWITQSWLKVLEPLNLVLLQFPNITSCYLLGIRLRWVRNFFSFLNHYTRDVSFIGRG